MSRREYKIGNYDFLTIEGTPIPPRPMVIMDQRHGVDGTEFTRVGKKGEPFQLVTSRDYGSYSLCFTYLNDYEALIGGDPVELLIADENMQWSGFKVNVLAVRPVRIMRIDTAVGALSNEVNGVKRGFMSCVWELIATEIIAEQ